MMRLVGIVGVILIILLIRNNQSGSLSSKNTIYQDKKVQNNTTTTRATSWGTFVPYWSKLEDYSRNPIVSTPIKNAYYFGVTLNHDGSINTNDSGYSRLSSFSHQSGIQSYLVVRLLNQDVLDVILHNSKIAKKAAITSSQLAKNQGFDGILLDLEYSSLPTAETKKQITTTIALFAAEAKNRSLLIGATFFGDTFYRSRPYDIKKLSKTLDEIVIMAYDYHKSKSLPGPLFPFEGQEYGYSFKIMLNDFLRYADPEKITIAYGLYGYQWRVDSKNRPIKPAVAKPYRIVVTALAECSSPNCTKYIDPKSQEVFVNTKNDDNSWSQLYSESPDSIKTKANYAQQMGITKALLWAHGYY